jgi:hypothetical protein
MTYAAARSARSTMRSMLAPAVVLLSSTLAACCVVHPYWLEYRALAFAPLTDGYALCVVVGSIVAVVGFAVVLLVAPVLGPGPPIAVGAASAVFGLLAGRVVHESGELLFVCIALGVGFAGLAAGGLVEVTRSDHPRRLVAVAWVLPLLLSWPWTTWVARHDLLHSAARLAPPVPVWTVVGAGAVLAAWSTYALLTDAPDTGRVASTTEAMQNAWFVASLGTGVAGIFALGATSDLAGLSIAWSRPLVLVGSALAIALLAAAAIPLGDTLLRPAYLCVVTSSLLGPPVLTFLVAGADAAPDRVSPVELFVLTAVGVATGLVVAGRPRAFLVAGPTLGLVGSVPAWLMPDGPWTMVAAAALLVAGLTATLVAGFALVARTEAAALVGFAAVVAGAVGSSTIPGLFTRGLTGELEPIGGGRVAVGLAAAAFIAVGAVAQLALHRHRPGPQGAAADVRVTRETGVTIA